MASAHLTLHSDGFSRSLEGAPAIALPTRQAEQVWQDHDNRGPIPWVWHGLIAGGFVTLLSGPAKKGKSTILSNAVRARRLGEEFLDRTTAMGSTLVLTEEGAEPFTYRWRDEVADLGPDGRPLNGIRMKNGRQQYFPTHYDYPSFEVVLKSDPALVDASWTDILGGVRVWVEQERQEHAGAIPLVIIDTLAVWAGIDDENAAGETTQAIVQVTALAEQSGAAIVLVHHTRKGGGAGGEAIRGSSAILATVGVSMELRMKSELSDDRSLYIQSRVGSPETLYLKFDRDRLGYSLGQNDAEEVGPASAPIGEVQQWLAAIPRSLAYSTVGFSVKDAREFWNMGDSAARKRIARMLTKRVIEAASEQQVRGNPTAFYRATTILAPTIR